MLMTIQIFFLGKYVRIHNSEVAQLRVYVRRDHELILEHLFQLPYEWTCVGWLIATNQKGSVTKYGLCVKITED